MSHTASTRDTVFAQPLSRAKVVTRAEIDGLNHTLTSVLEVVEEGVNGEGEAARIDDIQMLCQMISSLVDMVERQQEELQAHRARPIVSSFP